MCNVKCVIHESRVNHSSGEAARAFTEGWILFPDVPRSADSAALSEEMEGHPDDEAAFMAQKNLAGGKQTLKAWYWMVEGAAYDQEHGN